MADERWIAKIVKYCSDMKEKRVKIFCFGRSKELNISIFKDNDQVKICATKRNVPVGEIDNIRIGDGSLYNELTRIWAEERI